ncbi:MAG: beta galactosidase jelly roll domain-containing protein [Prolixibacteraceae bacterium]|nr:beta galactosidase jelly roll domain-containing protein [Prolixibacteraceae bacterium]
MKTLMKITVTVFLLAGFAGALQANRYYMEEGLRGLWHFKIGDNPEWASPGYDESNWQQVYVPARWEEEGYQGYDGFAWYRKRFEVPANFQGRELFLELGYIDDVDEVFFNGVKIGQTGSFPPYYSTAYNANRVYAVPQTLVHFNRENVVAVRVYDSQLEGGIVRGNIVLGAADIAIDLDVNLCGNWDFNTGRDPSDSNKKTIVVPGQWENQGYYNYDGYAVYSTTFNLPSSMAKKRMVFLAGRIDDFDQVFINDTFIGQTGDLSGRSYTEMHREFRNYCIPTGVLKAGKNTVEIRVYDKGGEGGILEGSVGLITQEKFIQYWRDKRKDKRYY